MHVLEHTFQAELQGEQWKRLLWESDLAHDKIHPLLGAGWTAVLKEACCVKAGVHKDKVNPFLRDVKEPLRLWPKKRYGGRNDFKGIVVTAPLLDWCVRRKYKPDVKTFQATARGGDMDAIRWLRKHKVPWHQDYRANACTGAAEGGHLDVLKWLRKQGCPWDEWTCRDAAGGGHFDVLKYAHENGCPWDERTCWEAARGGHLDVLKYAHEKGCPWNEGTCIAAAKGGHLNVLKYAHENGCPWDEWFDDYYGTGSHISACEWAAKGGHLNVLKYARENGCPWNRAVCRQQASTNGHHHVIAWIDEQPE